MSGVCFRDLGIEVPGLSLGVGSGTDGPQTAEILAAYEEHLVRTPPVSVVVGDVNSTVARRLAAARLGNPVDHVEAAALAERRGGPPRSMAQPWPAHGCFWG
jgi:UDP-N-acetylglucosamine 2-epimerase